MRQARQDLDAHSEEMVKRVRAQLDWRHIVSKHPLLALGAAAAAGYILAPRRVHCHCVDGKTIKETVAQAMDRVQPVASSKAPGLAAGLASMLMAMVVREGLSFASQFVRNIFDSQAGGAGRASKSFNQQPATASMKPHVTTNGEHP